MYFGPDSFTFRVHDASVDSAVATISIEIGSVNDQPIADDQNVGTNEDTPLDIILTGNDSDIEGHNLLLSTTPVTGPASGTIDVGIKPEVIHSNGFE